MNTISQTKLQTSLRREGFSFFEMMITVAIIGIIIAMVVPMWGNNDAFYAARDRRNAQELVSVSMMASAAGLNFVQGSEMIEILRGISRGAVVPRGALQGRSFSVPGLSEEDIKGAAKYVTLKDGALQYAFDQEPLQSGGTSL
jgi:prepilin-type N-terminal cleavage/methylation domain-containing protein